MPPPRVKQTILMNHQPKINYVHIICVENQTQNLWVFRIWTGITHLTENIFGLNCEDWDNMALSWVLCLALNCLFITSEEGKIVFNWAGGSPSMFDNLVRKLPYQSRQAKFELGNSNYTVSHKNVFMHFSFTHYT